jgi:hypothetical protein
MWRLWQCVCVVLAQITYDEFLVALLGSGAIPLYSGYKPTVNAGIATEFSTAGFRFGHSTLDDEIQFMDDATAQEVRRWCMSYVGSARRALTSVTALIDADLSRHDPQGVLLQHDRAGAGGAFTFTCCRRHCYRVRACSADCSGALWGCRHRLVSTQC